jgi:hypothetical protein
MDRSNYRIFLSCVEKGKEVIVVMSQIKMNKEVRYLDYDAHPEIIDNDELNTYGLSNLCASMAMLQPPALNP